jgi:choline kinase
MDAIILAAGSGRRLGSGRPKCLTIVGGRRLIDHQLDALAAAGVRRPVVVVGYKREQVIAALAGRARIVVNEDYARTNSLYSFLLARDHVDGATFVLNADVLFDPVVAQRLARRDGSALAHDSTSGEDAEHMKVEVSGGRLRSMGKRLGTARCAGENLGLLRLDAATARAVFAAAEMLVAAGGERAWLAAAINDVARRKSIECVDVAGTPWVEIDFPGDLAHARRHVWPAIARRHRRRREIAREWLVAEVAGAAERDGVAV